MQLKRIKFPAERKSGDERGAQGSGRVQAGDPADAGELRWHLALA